MEMDEIVDTDEVDGNEESTPALNGFSFAEGEKGRKSIKKIHVPKIRPFDTNLLTPDELRREFTKRPCCDENCISKLFKMPLDPFTQRCTPFSDSCVCNADPVVCFSVGDTNSTADLLARQKEFADFSVFVNSVRAVSQYWRKDEKTWTDFLVEMFKGKHTRSPMRGKFRWIYTLVHPDLGLKTVCRSAFKAIFGVTENKLEYVQKLVRSGAAGLTSDRETASVGRRPQTKKDVFRFFGMDFDAYHDNIKNWCDFSAVGESLQSLVATAWLCDYIDLDGDEQVSNNIFFNAFISKFTVLHSCFCIFCRKQPEDKTIHIDSIDVREMHALYLKDPVVIDAAGDDLLSYPAFAQLFREAFPKVTIRQEKGICGKCNICENIKSLMKKCPLRSDKLLLRGYRMMHRNVYMGEKLKYYERVAEARNSGGKVISLAFDSMSKFKTKIPHMVRLLFLVYILRSYLCVSVLVRRIFSSC
jgi:hypothetical protein